MPNMAIFLYVTRLMTSQWCGPPVLSSSHVSNQTSIKYGVLQGSVLGPLLFLICISDLNCAKTFCKVHHFADDKNLLHFSKPVNKLNKYINLDMKNLTEWLNANKILFNVEKTALVIFEHKKKKLECPIRIKLSHSNHLIQ